MKLIYKGTPPAHITGVPARDLSNDDITQLAANRNISTEQLIEELTARGLYALAPKRKTKAEKDDSA